MMDYQPAILDRPAGAHEQMSRTAGAVAAARSGGVPIGCVRVAFDDADYAAIPMANEGFRETAGGRRTYDATPETAIHDAVAPQPGDVVVRKTRVGAFSTTDLDRRPRDQQIDTLVLAGLSTSGVVLSTVRDAADRDYRLHVLEDGCADRDQDVHDLLTRKIFPRRAWVISTVDLPGLLAAG